MTSRSMRRSVALASLALALATAASATTMRRLETRDLTLGSSEIVVGTVESARSRWDANHRHIFTDVDVRVTRSLKGDGASRITLTQLGGEVGGVRYSIPGGPLFRPGEEALLFVWRDSRGRPQVNGLAQGKFDIERDSATGKATVQRHVPGFAVTDARRLAAAEGAAGNAPGIPLDDLVREIQRTLSEGAGR